MCSSDLNRYVVHSENPEGGGHIVLHGEYIYISSRVSNTAGAERCSFKDGIAIFKRLENGELKYLGYQPTGGHPRHFAITEDGGRVIVACRDDNRIELYPIDKIDGLMGQCIETINIPSPVYVDENSN